MSATPLFFFQVCFQVDGNRHASTDIHIIRKRVERYIDRNSLGKTHPVKGLLHLGQHLVIAAGV